MPTKECVHQVERAHLRSGQFVRLVSSLPLLDGAIFQVEDWLVNSLMNADHRQILLDAYVIRARASDALATDIENLVYGKIWRTSYVVHSSEIGSTIPCPELLRQLMRPELVPRDVWDTNKMPQRQHAHWVDRDPVALVEGLATITRSLWAGLDIIRRRLSGQGEDEIALDWAGTGYELQPAVIQISTAISRMKHTGKQAATLEGVSNWLGKHRAAIPADLATELEQILDGR